jgi:hypothetical protein
MKKVYKDITMSFYIEDDKNIDSVLSNMSIDIVDTTGKLEANNTFIDWEYSRDTKIVDLGEDE